LKWRAVECPLLGISWGASFSWYDLRAPSWQTPTDPPQVEYYPPNVKTIAEEEGEYEQEQVGEPGQPTASTRPPEISAELAELGVYARSMKPGKSWLTEELGAEPRHVLINISESALGALLPHTLAQLVEHAVNTNRRVYPRGSRVESQNMDPSLYWRTGSQIAALNWQTFDHGMQLNEALFVGTPGYVLKPIEMRSKEGEEAYAAEQLADNTDTTLDIEIAGLSSCTCHLRLLMIYITHC
jgi:phosphatidylinositol phospholipase C delta